MKKKILTIILCAFMLSACGNSTEPKKEFTAENLLNDLKEMNSNVGEIVVYDEETDPNGNLGRPGNYIGKADFSDIRIEQNGDDLIGGTIEVFENKDDCQDRADYLNALNDPSLGIFGVNAYIYQYDKAVFRIDYDLTPDQAEEYHEQMTEIIEQY